MEPGFLKPGNAPPRGTPPTAPPRGFNGARLPEARKLVYAPGVEVRPTQASMEPGFLKPGNGYYAATSDPGSRGFNGARLPEARKRPAQKRAGVGVGMLQWSQAS